MNIANPCKVFVLLGTFAFGFGIRADGTLPIPGAESSLQFPLLMVGATSEALDGLITKRDISMSLDTPAIKKPVRLPPTLGVTPPPSAALKACDKIVATPTFHAASGTVQVGDELFEIQGLCAPKTGKSIQRSVIALTSGRILQLDGSFKVSPLTKKLSFAGSALTIDTLASTPESGDDLAPVKVTFTMDQLLIEE